MRRKDTENPREESNPQNVLKSLLILQILGREGSIWKKKSLNLAVSTS